MSKQIEPTTNSTCLQQKLYLTVYKFTKLRCCQSFIDPIDTIIYPDYNDIIHYPMNLKKIIQKLKQGEYFYMHEVYQDLLLISKNCFLYHRGRSNQEQIKKIIGRYIRSLDVAWQGLKKQIQAQQINQFKRLLNHSDMQKVIKNVQQRINTAYLKKMQKLSGLQVQNKAVIMQEPEQQKKVPAIQLTLNKLQNNNEKISQIKVIFTENQYKNEQNQISTTQNNLNKLRELRKRKNIAKPQQQNLKANNIKQVVKIVVKKTQFVKQGIKPRRSQRLSNKKPSKQGKQKNQKKDSNKLNQHNNIYLHANKNQDSNSQQKDQQETQTLILSVKNQVSTKYRKKRPNRCKVQKEERCNNKQKSQDSCTQTLTQVKKRQNDQDQTEQTGLGKKIKRKSNQQTFSLTKSKSDKSQDNKSSSSASSLQQSANNQSDEQTQSNQSQNEPQKEEYPQQCQQQQNQQQAEEQANKIIKYKLQKYRFMLQSYVSWIYKKIIKVQAVNKCSDFNKQIEGEQEQIEKQICEDSCHDCKQFKRQMSLIQQLKSMKTYWYLQQTIRITFENIQKGQIDLKKLLAVLKQVNLWLKLLNKPYINWRVKQSYWQVQSSIIKCLQKIIEYKKLDPQFLKLIQETKKYNQVSASQEYRHNTRSRSKRSQSINYNKLFRKCQVNKQKQVKQLNLSNKYNIIALKRNITEEAITNTDSCKQIQRPVNTQKSEGEQNNRHQQFMRMLEMDEMYTNFEVVVDNNLVDENRQEPEDIIQALNGRRIRKRQSNNKQTRYQSSIYEDHNIQQQQQYQPEIKKQKKDKIPRKKKLNRFQKQFEDAFEINRIKKQTIQQDEQFLYSYSSRSNKQIIGKYKNRLTFNWESKFDAIFTPPVNIIKLDEQSTGLYNQSREQIFIN